MRLPEKKSTILRDIFNYIILIFGRPKIGKTEFCSYFEDALFIATEEGHNAQSVYKVDVKNWTELQETYTLVASGNHNFKTIILDTIDNAWEFAKTASAEEYGQKHIADVGYGKGHSKARDKIKSLISAFSRLPYGLVMISHSRTEEIESPVGNLSRETINIVDSKKEAETAVLSLADMILYFEPGLGKDDKPITVVRTVPNDAYIAGGRVKFIDDGMELDPDDMEGSHRRVIENFNKNLEAYIEKKEGNSQTLLDLKNKKEK